MKTPHFRPWYLLNINSTCPPLPPLPSAERTHQLPPFPSTAPARAREKLSATPPPRAAPKSPKRS